MVAYLGYTLRMRTLFRGWPIMVNDTHTRRRRLAGGQTQWRQKMLGLLHSLGWCWPRCPPVQKCRPQISCTTFENECCVLVFDGCRCDLYSTEANVAWCHSRHHQWLVQVIVRNKLVRSKFISHCYLYKLLMMSGPSSLLTVTCTSYWWRQVQVHTSRWWCQQHQRLVRTWTWRTGNSE